jgi:ParB-like chromosome segregation protein Spo0J
MTEDQETSATLSGQIVDLPVDELTLNSRNARTHSKKQITQIAASISEFGFTNPILVDASGKIVAGHGRIEAAKSLGLKIVPTLRLDHLSPAQIRAYMIADNRLAQHAGWDENILKLEFAELEEMDLGFDLETTGFDHADIDIMLGIEDVAGDDPADVVPSLHETAVTRLGDIWQIGEHRLVCGDAKDQQLYVDLHRSTLQCTD